MTIEVERDRHPLDRRPVRLHGRAPGPGTLRITDRNNSPLPPIFPDDQPGTRAGHAAVGDGPVRGDAEHVHRLELLGHDDGRHAGARDGDRGRPRGVGVRPACACSTAGSTATRRRRPTTCCSRRRGCSSRSRRAAEYHRRGMGVTTSSNRVVPCCSPSTTTSTRCGASPSSCTCATAPTTTSCCERSPARAREQLERDARGGRRRSRSCSRASGWTDDTGADLLAYVKHVHPARQARPDDRVRRLGRSSAPPRRS